MANKTTTSQRQLETTFGRPSGQEAGQGVARVCVALDGGRAFIIVIIVASGDFNFGVLPPPLRRRLARSIHSDDGGVGGSKKLDQESKKLSAVVVVVHSLPHWELSQPVVVVVAKHGA